MGALANKTHRIGAPSASRAAASAAGVALGLGLLLGAAPAAAESPVLPQGDAPVVAADQAVSTSPVPEGRTDLARLAPIATPGEARPALTRAATRQRIERMSPVSWLAGFGDVEVGRPE